MHSSHVVGGGNKEGQNRKLSSNEAGSRTAPIDLRVSEAKAGLPVVPRNCRYTALPPAPRIHERLVDRRQPNRHRRQTDNAEQQKVKSAVATHDSRLDKEARQSQSSTEDFHGPNSWQRSLERHE